MIVKRIEIERFGTLDHIVIDDLDRGVEVLHGTNETGKTTLLEFVRGVFFGFSKLVRRGYLDAKVISGGSLIVACPPNDHIFRLHRINDPTTQSHLRNDSVEDHSFGERLFVEDADGRLVDASLVADFMGNVDEKTFSSVMAFGLDELHELSSLDAEGSGQRLYELAGGLDRTSLSKVINDLRDASARIDSSDPSISGLASLLDRRQAAETRLAGLNAPALTLGAIASQAAVADAEVDKLQAIVQVSEHRHEISQWALNLEPHERLVRSAESHLAEMNASPLVHPDLVEWQTRVERHESLLVLVRKAKRTRARLARAEKQSPVPTTLWKHRTSVAALLDEQPRLERLNADLSHALAVAHSTARRLGEQLGRVGLARATTNESHLETVTERMVPVTLLRSFTPFKQLLQQLKSIGREVTVARQTLANAEAIASEATRAESDALLGTHYHSLADAIEEAGGLATLFRNRISAGNHVDDLESSIVRLKTELGELEHSQVLPVGWMIALGAMFVFGATLLLSGLLLPGSFTGSFGYAIAGLGLAGAGVASVTTLSLDRSAYSKLESTRRQLLTTRRQNEETIEQCRQLDARIVPNPGLSLESRLKSSQREVDRLEAIAVRAGSSQVLSDGVKESREHLEASLANRTKARTAWKRLLVRRGLPDTLSPLCIRELKRQRSELVELDDARRVAATQAKEYRESIAHITCRIDQLMLECGDFPESHSPIDSLKLLRLRLDSDRRSLRSRKRLHAKLVAARNRHRRSVRRADDADEQRKVLLVRWGVTTREEFLVAVDKRAEFELARQSLQKARADCAEMYSSIPDRSALEKWNNESQGTTVENRQLVEASELQHARQQLSDAREHRATLAAQLAALSSDRSSESLQTEIAEIERQIKEQMNRWYCIDTARQLVEEARRRFAGTHQPPVLKEASHWLLKLTDGRYTSITTTLDEPILFVSDNEGIAWRPERLSRGTREQVFLSLRLALIADLERRGVRMPIVMDDALVNFDDARAEAAARVLVEFASSQIVPRQLLVLTCHAHVASIFASAGARVRRLGVTTPAMTTALTKALPASISIEPTKRNYHSQTAAQSSLNPILGPGDGIAESPLETAALNPSVAFKVFTSSSDRVPIPTAHGGPEQFSPLPMNIMVRRLSSSDAAEGELDEPSDRVKTSGVSQQPDSDTLKSRRTINPPRTRKKRSL